MRLIPKNWDNFQHYKDRSPAWIKLHRGLLDDYEFSRLPVASRALAPLLWLLASEYERGEITADLAEIAFRLRMDENDLVTSLKPLIDKKFFTDASNTLADCKQDAIPERERELEKEKNAACAVSPVKFYAFESGVIRLTAKDFEKWKNAFSRLDLAAELIALAPWAAEQREWFHAVAGALAKRNRELKIRADQVQQGNGLPLTPSGNPWPEGIV